MERRVRRRHQITTSSTNTTHYLTHEQIAIPNDEIFSKTFQLNFLDHFRHGSSPNYPVVSLSVGGNPGEPTQHDLWPVVAAHRHNAFLVAVPEVDGFLVAKSHSDRPSGAQLPSVTATFALLEDLAPFVLQARQSIFSTSALATLQCHLCSIMPFGTPIETNMAIIETLRKPASARVTYPQKRPAWKPEVLSNMRQRLDVNVKETVSVMIYGRQQGGGGGRSGGGDGGDGSGKGTTGRGGTSGGSVSDSETAFDDTNSAIQDVCHISGVVECTSHLNGVPEVSLSITNANDDRDGRDGRRRRDTTKIEGGEEENSFPEIILAHECALPPSSIESRHLIFNPPSKVCFDLARYTFRNDARGCGVNNVPVRALYQVELIGDGSGGGGGGGGGGGAGGDQQQYDIRLHMRWGIDVSRHATVKDFEVILPFGGHVVHHTLTTTTGSLKTVDEIVRKRRRRRGQGGGDGSVEDGASQDDDVIRSRLLWTPGSKFKNEGADAILTGIITMASSGRASARPPEQLKAAPALVRGVCTGDRSPLPLSNQRVAMDAHVRRRCHEENNDDEKLEEEDSERENDERKNSSSSSKGTKKKVEKEIIEPVLQQRNPKEDWKTWSEFAAGGDESESDVMLSGANCYAELKFRIVGCTLSGTEIRKSSISVQPSATATITTSVELVSGKYFVWNKFGDSRHVSVPKEE